MRFDAKKMPPDNAKIFLPSAPLAYAILALFAVTATAADDLSIAFPTRYDPASLDAVWVTPFSEETDVAVRAYYTHDSPVKLLSASNLEQPVDVVFLSDIDAFDACRDGRLVPFDHALLRPSANGVRAGNDFLAGALPQCGVKVFARASVIAIDTGAFLSDRPRDIQSLFDVEKFPGPRALTKTPQDILEWALLSYRVPRDDLYNLLSTERGLNLVFARLDAINDDTFWCDDPALPAQMLRDGRVVMASGFVDNFFDAKTHGQTNIEIIWDGQILDMEQVAISSLSKRPDLGTQFIAFITEAVRMRDYAERRLIGPMRQSSVEMVRVNTATSVDISSQVPTHPVNLERAVFRDVEWYARTRTRLALLFENWFKRATRKRC